MLEVLLTSIYTTISQRREDRPDQAAISLHGRGPGGQGQGCSWGKGLDRIAGDQAQLGLQDHQFHRHKLHSHINKNSSKTVKLCKV